MSVEAISLAFAAPVQQSSAKFVLVAMANLAGADLRCWPSVQYLGRVTSQDRKTVLKNIDRLSEQGLVLKTGARRGAVPVYQLCFDRVPEEVFYDDRNDPESGQKQSQKRDCFNREKASQDVESSPVFPQNQSQNWDSLHSESVPKTGQVEDEISTVFPENQSQFSQKAVPFFRESSPKNGTQTLKGHERDTKEDTQPNNGQLIPTDVAISIELRKRGVNVNPFNPVLIEAVKQGVTVDLMLAAHDEAKVTLRDRVPSLGYLVSILGRWARESRSMQVAGAAPSSSSSARKKFDVLSHNNRHRLAGEV